ncbi:MAG: sulfatase-like hydrolase/transferase [Gammaproteobacteria bacterium]|nr:sulfatase-like hydrolase/transferase [Gammaproteobacteria bacterium]
MSLVGCSKLATESSEEMATPEKPSIIFILADDIGFNDLSVNGQQSFDTPNLDALAAEGVNFTNFYAGSEVCGPSRSVLMTCQHNGRTPVRANFMTIKQPDGSKQFKGRSFYPEEVLVSEVLKDAGYRTDIVGKWGLGEIDDTGHPNKQGFDYFYGYLNHVHAHNPHQKFC